MNSDLEKKCREILIGLIPPDGTTIGNVTLLPLFLKAVKQKLSVDLTDKDYWEIRDKLIAEGSISKGRGRGGSVFKEKLQPVVSTTEEFEEESSLYKPFCAYIRRIWAPEDKLSEEDFILEETYAQGRRNTGGKWTRPDLTLIAVRRYDFNPGKILDVVTFELKENIGYQTVEGVFEAVAHTAFTHRSYLAIHAPKDSEKKGEFERVEKECGRFGIGLITFSDPEKLETYTIILDAVRKNPDPQEVADFIVDQIKPLNQNKIRKLLQ